MRWAIDRVVTPLGRRIDEAAPMVDARLPDGSRMHAIIPPAAIRGASLTIRKFPGRSLTLDALTRGGSLSTAMAAFLAFGVRARRNLIVSGGTGSGKTTLLNVLSNEIPDAERVITIEDAAELRLEHAHRVALEARPPNAEGKGRIDIRELVRNALRMRPDRIVVGECRGGEAFDMLTAMNTGHEGSLTTLHANSPRDALARLEAMVLMAGLDLPLAAVREHIAASVDLILQSARLADGQRLVTSIVELTGIESGRIQLQELFRFDRRQGFVACGVFPAFARAGNEIGGLCDPAWFQAPPSEAVDGASRPGRGMADDRNRGRTGHVLRRVAGRADAGSAPASSGTGCPMALSALHRARIRRRASMFERQLSVALPMLSSSLRAGAALNTALRHLAENGEAPLSQELGLLREQRLGIPWDEALARLEQRVPSEATALTAAALRIATRSGGNLAEALDRIADTLRARSQLQAGCGR